MILPAAPAALLLASALPLQSAAAAGDQASTVAPEPTSGTTLPSGTPIELMVLKEVNSRTAKPGDRIRLRVNAPVVIEGRVAVPVGATAWAEVMSSKGTNIAGGRGRLTIRVVQLDTAAGIVRLTGTLGQVGKANTAGVAIGVLSFGLAGLLNKGGNATFKAGDIVTAHVGEGGDETPLVAAPL